MINSYSIDKNLEIPTIIIPENRHDNIFKKKNSFRDEFDDEEKAYIDDNDGDFIQMTSYKTNQNNLDNNYDSNNHCMDKDAFVSDDNTSKSNNSDNNIIIYFSGSSKDLNDNNTKSTSQCSSPRFLSRTNSSEVPCLITNKSCIANSSSINENDTNCTNVNDNECRSDHDYNNTLDDIRDCYVHDDNINKKFHEDFTKMTVNSNNNNDVDVDRTILNQLHSTNKNCITSFTDDSNTSHCAYNDQNYS